MGGGAGAPVPNSEYRVTEWGGAGAPVPNSEYRVTGVRGTGGGAALWNDRGWGWGSGTKQSTG